MSTGSVLLTLLIAFWAVIEYRRRERRHDEVLKMIREGKSPAPPAEVPTRWKLGGEALFVLLLAAASALTIRGGAEAMADPWILTGMGLLFGIMMVLVLLMLGRDIRIRKSTPPHSRSRP